MLRHNEIRCIFGRTVLFRWLVRSTQRLLVIASEAISEDRLHDIMWRNETHKGYPCFPILQKDAALFPSAKRIFKKKDKSTNNSNKKKSMAGRST